MLRAWVFLLILFCRIPVHSQEPIETIPFELVHNLIFIEVRINDAEKPLNFLFDTGAGVTVIDSKISEQLSLPIMGNAKINTSGKSLLSKESTANSLTIGKKILLDSVNLILMDLTHISRYLNTTVDGVIGFDLLNTFITETNIDREEVRFYDPKTFIYKGDGVPLELTTLESNLFGIVINAVPKNRREPIELNFQIDTGADNYLTFHTKTIEEHQLLDTNKKPTFREGFGADATITNNIRSKVNTVSFGGEKWKYIPVMFEVDPINKRENSLAEGLIGQRLLLDFNIIYHLDERIVYFEKRK